MSTEIQHDAPDGATDSNTAAWGSATFLLLRSPDPPELYIAKVLADDGECWDQAAQFETREAAIDWISGVGGELVELDSDGAIVRPSADRDGPADDEVAPPDDDSLEAPEEPAAPPHEQGATPEELEAMRKRLDKATTDWRKKVAGIMGEQFHFLVPCELCGSDVPGFHFPAEFLTPETEVEARLIDALLATEAPELLPSVDVRRCAACDGRGKTLTGSRVGGKERITCKACKGYGYTPPPTAGVGDAGDQDAAELDPDAPPAPVADDDHDLWGSPKLLPNGEENPNYGRFPQYKHPDLP